MKSIRFYILEQLIRFRWWCDWVLRDAAHPRQSKPIFFTGLEPIVISLIISAASFGAQLLVTKLLQPKQKPQVKGKLTGDITLTDSIWGAPVVSVFGDAPGSGDNAGGMEVGCNIIWASEIRKIQTQVPGGTGGHQGKGGGGASNTPDTIQINYKIDLAAAVGRGPLKLLRVKFNEDTVFGGSGSGGGTGPEATRYEAESLANTLAGTAEILTDADCSNGKKVAGIGPNGTLTFNFDSAAGSDYDEDPPGPTPSFPFYFFTIYYKSVGDRQAYVKLNGTGGVYTFPDTGGAVGAKFISRRYFEEAAALEISSPNDEGPEIDCLDISIETIYEPDGRQTGARDLNFPSEAAQDNILLPDPLDYDTNALERFNAPVPDSTDSVIEITLANGANLAWYEGTEDQPVDAVIAGALGAESTPAFRGTAYARISNLDFTKYGSLPNIRFLVANTETRTVSEICLKLALDAGLEESDLDLTAGENIKVRGYVIDGIAAPSKAFEELGLIYNLSFSETSSGRIVARDLSDRTARATIRQSDLGAFIAGEDEEKPIDKVTSTIIDESVDLVRELEIQFYNPDLPVDYGTDRAKAVYPFTGTKRVETRSISALLTKAECLSVARRELQKNHIKISPVAFNLPYKYANLEPGECFDIEIENNLHRYRLEEKTGAAPGVFECSATNENIIVTPDAALDAPDAPGGETELPPVKNTKAQILIPANTVGTIIDAPPFIEALDGKTGVYVAGRSRGTGRWESATVYREKGGGWQQVKVLTKPATMGRAIDILAPIPEARSPEGIDETNSVTIDFFGTDEPTTVTKADLLDGANPFLIGGEIVTVQTWTRDNDYPNRWTATNIRRGQRNTERFAALHVAGERVVMLSDAVEFVPLDRDEVGLTRTWKFVTGGAQIDDAAPLSFTWTGDNLIQGKNVPSAASRPLTPSDIGKTITNDGAVDAVEYQLPDPVEETEYRFAVVNDFGIRVVAPGDRLIRFGTRETKNGSYVQSTAIGSYLCLRVVAGVWMKTESGGDWEVN